MNAKYFLDTNIFVYSFDKREPEKQNRAEALIGDALARGNGIISTQVIQEFLNVATRKFTKPMQLSQSLIYLNKVLNPLCQVVPDLELYRNALEVQDETGYSFYDSLILAGAIRGGCRVLLTEDMRGGLKIEGLEIVNPFGP